MEKHADFLRNFRGHTTHPFTQDLLADLGLLDEFLTPPHDDMPLVPHRQDPGRTLPVHPGWLGLIVAIDRGDFFQIAHVIPAGA